MKIWLVVACVAVASVVLSCKGASGDPVVELRAGKDTSCLRTLSGNVRCWGDAAFASTTKSASQLAPPKRTRPTSIGWKNAKGLAISAKHGCAVTTEGRIQCFLDEDGRLLHYSVTTITNATQLSPHANGTCALLDSGQISCFARLGSGGPIEPAIVPSIDGATRVAAGDTHVCALLKTGQVTCWGASSSGQLGDGPRLDSPPNARQVPLPNTATDVVAGSAFSCALTADRLVACWGSNSAGQLGHSSPGLSSSSAHPSIVSGPTDIVQVSAGVYHVCAVASTGSIWCWGDDRFGQLGRGSKSSQGRPRQVVDIDDALQVAVGEWHSCALRRTGAVSCWGRNQRGQLGNGETDDSTTPVEVGL